MSPRTRKTLTLIQRAMEHPMIMMLVFAPQVFFVYLTIRAEAWLLTALLVPFAVLDLWKTLRALAAFRSSARSRSGR